MFGHAWEELEERVERIKVLKEELEKESEKREEQLKKELKEK